MALEVQPPSDRKRVKVYELRDNDWFDRGTGFCTGEFLDDEPRIFVQSEDEPERVLLETKISKDDGYQKQQETLIVWTEPNGTDMALSFQEPDGCAVIWNFVNGVQQHLTNLAPADDAFSDDLETYQSIMLPAPELGNLPEIDHVMRAASMTQAGRDALSKFVIREEYITKLIPLVTRAEGLENLLDLHRLCNIMKSLILLNDNTIIETVVTDPIILGVVGALEYDPEFPTHKANHRQYLADQSRYKEVVPIKDALIRRKIRYTWRLQYLKDVVLARILDDPTFSVLNSLIFFNQVEIVNHIQSNGPFLKELFSVFDPRNTDAKRKEDAVQFLHQCASIAKNLQAPARANLFANFISHGLFAVIAFAIKHPNPAMRTTGIDILVALLDHDPLMMRGYMLKAVNEKKTPLTDTLIDLLHLESDLGVKNQLADAVKVLLDPQILLQDTMGRAGPEQYSKPRPNILSDAFVQNHFDESAKRLFMPLKRLETRASLSDLKFQEVALYAHLVDILTFFVRQHLYRSRAVIHNEALAPRVAQLLTVPQKHLKLIALKFFRTLISLQDTFYQALMTHNNTFGLILDIVYETMPRDNLLNSACLELFEFIKRENIKPIVLHVVEKYGEKLKNITYVNTFQDLILRYEQMQGYGTEAESTLYSQDESTPARRVPPNGQRWQGVREMDAAEEEYFNTSDDEEEWQHETVASATVAPQMQNGSASPVVKPLVDYPDDDEDDDDAMDTKPEGSEEQKQQQSVRQEGTPTPDAATESSADTPSTPVSSTVQTPPERLSEKRRREEEDDDELVKLSSGPKRRSSTSGSPGGAGMLRKKRSVSIGSLSAAAEKGTTQSILGTVTGSTAPKRIAINLSSKPSPETDSTDSAASTPSSEKENRGENHGESG
ncbi:component of IIS longevity pathway SMK-1-domain-containing protein [Aspergillus tamarii]|uniref:Component of IIS longevity pathway SMK-1-domain-containing protein n=1 Tax=Aspergillus tamarii TaxID=41984 RepID=A0A5N6URT0_ASPTM|nr:component of IIS longevity pathway SMK-1-domain-containing protein [Aspergillus tamarii]